jgi:hypothetical protein
MNHTTTSHRAENRSEETSIRAYHLWQKAGSPPGEDLKYWLQAEEQLFGRHDDQPQRAVTTEKPANPKATGAARSKAAGAARSKAKPAGNGPTKRQPATAIKSTRMR